MVVKTPMNISNMQCCEIYMIYVFLVWGFRKNFSGEINIKVTLEG